MTFLTAMKKEFFKGFFGHEFPSIICLIYCVFGCLITDFYSVLLGIELLLMIDISRTIFTRRELMLFITRHLISRIIMGVIICMTIDENYWILIASSPIWLSWYVFDPYLIRNKRLSFTERIDYFLSRSPYFFGYSLIPFGIISVWYFTEINYFLYLTVCLMINYRSELDTPKCYRGVPYTNVTYKTDPADVVEDFITKFF